MLKAFVAASWKAVQNWANVMGKLANRYSKIKSLLIVDEKEYSPFICITISALREHAHLVPKTTNEMASSSSSIQP